MKRKVPKSQCRGFSVELLSRDVAAARKEGLEKSHGKAL